MKAEQSRDIDYLRTWIGRSETVEDALTSRLAQCFGAMFDLKAEDIGAGAPAPLGIHWCLAPVSVATEDLGRDGHPARGGFLPPVAFPRRMWAGGRVEFLDAFRVGDLVARTSTVSDVRLKQGQSGPLCFVTVMHEIASRRGIAVRERQDIVYREGGVAKTHEKCGSTERESSQKRVIVPSPVLLFRYSALSFNGHRIHYDRNFCLEEEGYPGLVVHGPLQASLLLMFASDLRGGRCPRTFEFRSVHPLYDEGEFTLHSVIDSESYQLWTADGKGRRTMIATAQW